MNLGQRVKMINAKVRTIEACQELLTALAIDETLFNEHKVVVFEFMHYLNHKMKLEYDSAKHANEILAREGASEVGQ